MELNRYIGCRITEFDYNLTLLEWWEKNESYFPRLSQVAKKYLGVLASSVPSERVLVLQEKLSTKNDDDYTLKMLIFSYFLTNTWKSTGDLKQKMDTYLN